ncbi:MAG: 50S ribosomal protein L5 [Erysipelotrichaceae bacterium]|jgi:large subunit ribosomal protein L5
MNRLTQKFNDEVVKNMMKRFNYSSVMQCPRLEKIVINMGVGDAIANPKAMEEAIEQLTLISGQKPVVTKAKKSIANFKLREGMSIGCKVTLRGERMYDFFDKLISIALPRVRDFRGVSKTAFDGRGNYTLGVKEQLIFPEISYDKVSITRGMDIVIVTTAKTNQEAHALLEALGMPFTR